MGVVENNNNTFASLTYHYPIKSIMANVVSGGRVYFVIDQYPRTSIKSSERLRQAFYWPDLYDCFSAFSKTTSLETIPVLCRKQSGADRFSAVLHLVRMC